MWSADVEVGCLMPGGAWRHGVPTLQYQDQDAGSTTSAMRQQYQAATDRHGR
jgi:hypothetical protein